MLLISLLSLSFSSTPTDPPKPDEQCTPKATKYTGPVDYVIETISPCDGSTCFNRYSPHIPMALTVPSGSVVNFKTTDIWDKPGWDYTSPTTPEIVAHNMELVFEQIDVVHVLTGPVAVEGAKAGDTIAIEILDIDPLDKGFTFAGGGLGFIADDMTASGDQAWVWWDFDEETETWTSKNFPDIVVPNHPFPGSIAVLPSAEQVEFKLKTHLNETTLYGGPTWPQTTSLAIPESICGEGAPLKDTCLKTLSPGDWFGNTDTQRMARGTTLFVKCYVDGCGVATGDVHGAQGDGELSITAIEYPAAVTMKLTLIPADTPTPEGPYMMGTDSIRLVAPEEWISFMGHPFKSQGILPDQYRWEEYSMKSILRSSHIIPESMVMAARNALAKCMKFLMDAGGYTFAEAMILTSVMSDIRVAQLVDKPGVGIECILNLANFKGEMYMKLKKAANPLAA